MLGSRLRSLPALLVTAGFIVVAVPSFANESDPSLKKAWARVGHGMRDATREVGHATRDFTRAVGHTSRDAARGAAKATGRTAKQVGRDADAATREARKDAADAGQGLWAQTKQGIANALDGIADALGLADESD
jgi:hypothetical protein